jgi:hypothetical protein
MADVTVAADFGASLGRAIYSTAAGYLKPELLLLDPQVVQVPEKSIENYEKYKIGQANPEDSAWVNFGEAHFAVGFLAKKNFHAVHCLESLKVDSAIPQTLSLVGSIAQKLNLLPQFSLSLGILLPWNEFRDREKFQFQISGALSDYTFRGQQFSVQLESFAALPEGGGIFARGRVPEKPGQKLRNPKELTVAVIMLGYRNSSILVIEKADMTRSDRLLHPAAAFWLPFAYQHCTEASWQEVQQLARSAVYQLKLHVQYLEDCFGLNSSSAVSEVTLYAKILCMSKPC